MAQMLRVQADYSEGGWSQIAVVMPNCSSGSQVFAETCRKLRERFNDSRDVAEVTILNRWESDLPAYS